MYIRIMRSNRCYLLGIVLPKIGKEVVLAMNAYVEKALRHSSTGVIVALGLCHVVVCLVLTMCLPDHCLQSMIQATFRRDMMPRERWGYSSISCHFNSSSMSLSIILPSCLILASLIGKP